MARSLARFIWSTSARHQFALAALSVVVFVLSAAPLELQRRIVNDAIRQGHGATILWLAAAYAAVAAGEGAIKLALNIYRGWVSENAVRGLRRSIFGLIASRPTAARGAAVGGVEISMVLAEVEPVGSFVGVSVSEPLLQGGILLSVFAYMTFLQPEMAALSFLLLAPQLVFVPLMQRAINRRATWRIRILRDVSVAIVAESVARADGVAQQGRRADRVLRINMQIFQIKYSMNFLMNLLHHLAIAGVLAVGGLYAVEGRLEIGTVVACVSGLAKVNDPWGDVINWFREMTMASVKYQLLVAAADTLAEGDGADAAAP